MTFGLLVRALLFILAGAIVGGTIGFAYDLYTIVGTVEVDSPFTGQRVGEGVFIGAAVAVLIIAIGAMWRR
jgi:hypothetical protein